MPRRKYLVEMDQFDVFMPKEISDRLRLICTNPKTGKLEYGKRSKIITSLVTEMLVKGNYMSVEDSTRIINYEVQK